MSVPFRKREMHQEKGVRVTLSQLTDIAIYEQDREKKVVGKETPMQPESP